MAEEKTTEPEVQLVRIDPSTKEEQEVCDHEWKKAYMLMAGMVVEVCPKCKLRRKPRYMTDEEAEKAYA